MQSQIDVINNFYKELIDELKVDAETMTNTLINGNSSPQHKAIMFQKYRLWFFQALKSLEIERNNKIQHLINLPM